MNQQTRPDQSSQFDLVGQGVDKCVYKKQQFRCKIPDINTIQPTKRKQMQVLSNKPDQLAVVLPKYALDAELATASKIHQLLDEHDIEQCIIVLSKPDQLCRLDDQDLPGCKLHMTQPVAVLVDRGEHVAKFANLKMLAQMLLNLVYGMHVLAQARLVHGDIKYANLVVHQNKLKMIDFGMMHSYDDLQGGMLGRPGSQTTRHFLNAVANHPDVNWPVAHQMVMQDASFVAKYAAQHHIRMPDLLDTMCKNIDMQRFVSYIADLATHNKKFRLDKLVESMRGQPSDFATNMYDYKTRKMAAKLAERLGRKNELFVSLNVAYSKIIGFCNLDDTVPSTLEAYQASIHTN